MSELFHLKTTRIIDQNGIADGASLHFYATGTLTPAAIYTDDARTVPHTNPVVVGAGAALPDIYLDPAVTYRCQVKNAAGETIDDLDPYLGLSANGVVTADGDTVQEKLDAVQTSLNARPTTTALAAGPNVFGPMSVFSNAAGTSPGNFTNDTAGSAVSGIVSSIGTSAGNANNTTSFHFLGVTQGVALWYLYGNGTTSYSSDRRLKKNIEPARQDYLDDFLQLSFCRYNMRNDEEGAPKQLGVIADEAKEVFPSLVETALHKLYEPDEDPEDPNAGEYYNVFKYGVLPLITGCVVQELGRKCLTLEETVAALEARIAALETA